MGRIPSNSRGGGIIYIKKIPIELLGIFRGTSSQVLSPPEGGIFNYPKSFVTFWIVLDALAFLKLLLQFDVCVHG